jgi:hypothetical protein
MFKSLLLLLAMKIFTSSQISWKLICIGLFIPVKTSLMIIANISCINYSEAVFISILQILSIAT